MKKFILLLLSLQCCLYNMSLAQNPGDEIGSFFSFGGFWTDIAAQPDGKILVVGNIVARFDSAFNLSAFDFLYLDSPVCYGESVDVQPDGKIVMAGRTYYGNMMPDDFVLKRYNAGGSPDSTFDGDGSLITDLLSGSDDQGHELAIQPDGKIIVVGVSGGQLALCRYHSNGSLDSTFDFDGKLIVQSVNVDPDLRSYIKLQTDGRILVGNGDRLFRLNIDGSLDLGWQGTSLPKPMNDLVIQPDGKVVLAGSVYAFEVLRLNADGSIDTAFGNSGMVTLGAGLQYGPHWRATSIALQVDGRILAGGYTADCTFGACREFLVMRFETNGSLDNSFGSNGIAMTAYFPQIASMSLASVISGNKIILVGHSHYPEDHGIVVSFNLGWWVWPVDANTVSGNVENFLISPNPASGEVNIEASGIENGLWHLELRDVAGRQILREDVVASNSSIQKKISLTDLSAGLYFLQIDNGKRKMTSKLVRSGNW